MIEVQEISVNYLLRFAEAGYLHAIIDSCDSLAVPAKMLELGEPNALSLFKGSQYEEYTAIAPYLVTVTPNLLEWILQKLWEQPWGIMTLSKASLGLLTSHFRRFLFAFLPDGKAWYFRFYDPRILPVYLNICTQPELSAIFGPIQAYVIRLQGKLTRMSLSFTVPAYEPQGPLTLWPIRPEQIRALDQTQMEDFVSRISAYLRTRFPERTQATNPDELSETVQRLIHRGISYQLTRELDLLRYVIFSFSIPPELDRGPRLTATDPFAQDTTLTGEERMDRLSELAAFTEETPTHALA